MNSRQLLLRREAQLSNKITAVMNLHVFISLINIINRDDKKLPENSPEELPSLGPAGPYQKGIPSGMRKLVIQPLLEGQAVGFSEWPGQPHRAAPRNIRNMWSDGISCRNGEINGFCPGDTEDQGK